MHHAVISGRNRPCEYRICETCGVTFSASLVALRLPTHGRFCSKRCHGVQSRSDSAAWGRIRQQVFAAVKSGALKKQPCERCGSVTVEAHHPDYAKPLDVQWLCHRCHQRLHKEMRDATGVKRFAPWQSSTGRPYKTKLNPQSVTEIRASIGKQSLRSLAKRFGVSMPTILKVRDRRTWKHVA